MSAVRCRAAVPLRMLRIAQDAHGCPPWHPHLGKPRGRAESGLRAARARVRVRVRECAICRSSGRARARVSDFAKVPRCDGDDNSSGRARARVSDL